MTVTKSLTWQHVDGDIAPKETVSFGAGEDVVLSFSPAAVTSGTNRSLAGRQFQLVIAGAQDSPALVNKLNAAFTIVDSPTGLYTVKVASVDALTIPTDVYPAELRDVANGGNSILRRIQCRITGNPLANAGGSPYPPATIAWAQVTGTPTTLAGYGITDGGGGGGSGGLELEGSSGDQLQLEA